MSSASLDHFSLSFAARDLSIGVGKARERRSANLDGQMAKWSSRDNGKGQRTIFRTVDHGISSQISVRG